MHRQTWPLSRSLCTLSEPAHVRGRGRICLPPRRGLCQDRSLALILLPRNRHAEAAMPHRQEQWNRGEAKCHRGLMFMHCHWMTVTCDDSILSIYTHTYVLVR